VAHACVISAHTNRVPVLDGHTMTVSVEFANRVSPADVAQAMRAFRGRPQELGLPSAPVPAIEVMDEPNRPQPRLDADRGDGMTVSVGRVRECPVCHGKFVAHNVVRGAAGRHPQRGTDGGRGHGLKTRQGPGTRDQGPGTRD
jgi:aspartate-semialdehyde dehydrogenase